MLFPAGLNLPLQQQQRAYGERQENDEFSTRFVRVQRKSYRLLQSPSYVA